MATLLWTSSLADSSIRISFYVQIFILIFIMWNTLSSKRDLVLALQAFVLGTWVVIVQLLMNYGAGNVTRWDRRVSIANSNENDIALILALALPIAWYLATTGGATLLRSPICAHPQLRLYPGWLLLHHVDRQPRRPPINGSVLSCT